MLVIVAIAGLLHHVVRDGMATVEANHREYRLMLEFEIPVLALALASFPGKRSFSGLAGRFMWRLRSS